MDTPTPDSAAPVAYRFRFIYEDGDKGEWRLLLPEDYDLLDAPFYEVERLVPAATVTALEAEVERLRAAIRGIRFDTYELETPELVEAFDGNRRISVVHVETLHPLLQSLTGAGAK